MSRRHPFHSLLVATAICGALLVVDNNLGSIGPPVTPAKGGVRQMTRERWSAEFVDAADAAAVRRWARGMCKGLQLSEIAQELDVEPTVASVARRLTSGMPEPAEAIARRTCEEELRKADGTSV